MKFEARTYFTAILPKHYHSTIRISLTKFAGVNMKLDFSNINWRRVILAGLASPVLGFVFLVLALTLYAVGVAFRTGRFDQTIISKFLTQIGPSATPIILMITTIWAAMHVSRGVKSEQILHGSLVGVIASAPALAIGIILAGTFDLTVLGLAVLTLAAGYIGGQMGSQEQRNRKT